MEHKNVYYIYKHIVNSAFTPKDMNYLSTDIANQNVINVLSTMEYMLNTEHMSDIDFIEFIDKISKERYREDIYNMLESNKHYTNIQKNCIDRIVKNKPTRKYDVDEANTKQICREEKNCPHCGHNNISYKDNIYYICGYTNKGYDLEGCGNDWCFSCGKRLCKNWINNDLFMISNRFHNNRCCKKYAEDNNLDYDNDFCHCSNSFVNRKA